METLTGLNQTWVQSIFDKGCKCLTLHPLILSSMQSMASHAAYIPTSSFSTTLTSLINGQALINGQDGIFNLLHENQQVEWNLLLEKNKWACPFIREVRARNFLQSRQTSLSFFNKRSILWKNLIKHIDAPRKIPGIFSQTGCALLKQKKTSRQLRIVSFVCFFWKN